MNDPTAFAAFFVAILSAVLASYLLRRLSDTAAARLALVMALSGIISLVPLLIYGAQMKAAEQQLPTWFGPAILGCLYLVVVAGLGYALREVRQVARP